VAVIYAAYVAFVKLGSALVAIEIAMRSRVGVQFLVCVAHLESMALVRAESFMGTPVH
jgi:hypothetical protein